MAEGLLRLDTVCVIVSPEAWRRVLDYEVTRTKRTAHLATLTVRVGLSARVGSDDA